MAFGVGCRWVGGLGLTVFQDGAHNVIHDTDHSQDDRLLTLHRNYFATLWMNDLTSEQMESILPDLIPNINLQNPSGGGAPAPPQTPVFTWGGLPPPTFPHILSRPLAPLSIGCLIGILLNI